MNRFIADWLPVVRGTKIDFDLENTPLEIKTDSVTGSSDKVIVYFYGEDHFNDSGYSLTYAGGVKIIFESTLKYSLVDCSLYTDHIFPITPTTDVNKVWRITLTKTNSGTTTTRLVIHCNDKEVLNLVLSNTVCSSDQLAIWNRDVTKIEFPFNSNPASDFYRAYIPGNSCSHFKLYFFKLPL